MVKKLQKRLRESASARWLVLILISLTMMFGYYLTDVLSPLKTLLETENGWSSTDFGFFRSSYGWLNIFALMLILGGIILDKLGARLTGLMSTILMIIGVGIKYYAISTTYPEGATLFGHSMQVSVACIGYAIYAVGVEIAGITATRIIVKWFKGKEMALAMGVQVALARVGTFFAMILPIPIAIHFGSELNPNLSAPVLLGLISLCVGLLSFIVFIVMDTNYDKQTEEDGLTIVISDEDKFKISDIGKILSNKGFWMIALLCVLFYSAVFPFLAYAVDLVVNKFGMDPKIAGWIPSILPMGTLVFTPIFGAIYDKKGKGATIMIIGTVMLIFVHAMFSIPSLSSPIIAGILVFILGIAFSLVPSAMWPSVPKIIPEQQLGTAYSLIFWIQNWGLAGVPYLIGWVLDKYCKIDPASNNGAHYNYTIPMIIFTVFGVLALFIALWLKREDKTHNWNLEQPNMKK